MRVIHYPDGFKPSAGGIELLHEGEAFRV
jgi:hypothetical protein